MSINKKIKILTIVSVFMVLPTWSAEKLFIEEADWKNKNCDSKNDFSDQVQRIYIQKISYLESELNKSKNLLAEQSIKHGKMHDYLNARLEEESKFCRKEIVAKSKTIMEYQRQLEKNIPSEEVKNLITINTKLTIEQRMSADHMATISFKNEKLNNPTINMQMRLPASTKK